VHAQSASNRLASDDPHRPTRAGDTRAAALHRRFKGIPDTADTNRKRVRRDTKPFRYVAPALDSLTTGVAIILNHQRALIRPQFLQAALEALEPLLLDPDGFRRLEAPG